MAKVMQGCWGFGHFHTQHGPCQLLKQNAANSCTSRDALICPDCWAAEKHLAKSSALSIITASILVRNTSSWSASSWPSVPIRQPKRQPTDSRYCAYQSK